MFTADILSPTQTLEERVYDANRLFEMAVEAQRAGDWALYGERIGQLGQLLQELSSTNDSDEVPVLESPSKLETP